MRMTRMGLLAALAIAALPLAVTAQVSAAPAQKGECHLAPAATMQKTSHTNCGAPFIEGNAVTKVKEASNDVLTPGAKTDANAIADGRVIAVFSPPDDPIAHNIATGGLMTMSYTPQYSDDAVPSGNFVCAGGSNANFLDGGGSVDVGWKPKPCTKATPTAH